MVKSKKGRGTETQQKFHNCRAKSVALFQCPVNCVHKGREKNKKSRKGPASRSLRQYSVPLRRRMRLPFDVNGIEYLLHFSYFYRICHLRALRSHGSSRIESLSRVGYGPHCPRREYCLSGRQCLRNPSISDRAAAFRRYNMRNSGSAAAPSLSIKRDEKRKRDGVGGHSGGRACPPSD